MKGTRALGLLLGVAACAAGALAPATTQAAKPAHNVASAGLHINWKGNPLATIDPGHGSIKTEFSLNENARVKVRIYPVGSQKSVFKQLFLHDLAGQTKTIYWNGKNRHGKPVPLGKYYIVLTATTAKHATRTGTFGPFTALHTVAPKPAAAPAPAGAPTAPPVTVAAAGKHIVISLSRQTLYAYTGDHLDLQTYVTTGNPALPTPTGSYSVMTKQSPFWFISPWPIGSPYYYAPSLSNFAMLFRSGGYYIHDAPWRSAYGPGTNGAGQPGTNYGGTHGCVNVPYNAMVALWNWTSIGTAVFVVS
jgi:lipoprotein-anchoring transpeptidase ErfK/SrfK